MCCYFLAMHEIARYEKTFGTTDGDCTKVQLNINKGFMKRIKIYI